MGKFANQFDHHHQSPSNRTQIRSGNRGKKNPIKVTYIASPTKVKASNASEFRAIVQELTGKDSDVATAVIPLVGPEANQVHDQRVAEKSFGSVADGEALIISHLASSSSSSLDQFDDPFLWRDGGSSSGGSSFGFQSPSASSLYDYVFTAT